MHKMLQNLLTTNLIGIKRTLDMVELHFVNTNNIEYALHVMCPYRMMNKQEMLFGKDDLLLPSSKILNREDFSLDSFYNEGDTFYMEHGNNYLDEIIQNKFVDINFDVVGISMADIGDLCIHFSNGYIFEAYIDNRFGEECWRLLKKKMTCQYHILS